MTDSDVTAGHDLDGQDIRSLERFHDGQPPVWEPDVLYRYERDEDDQLVLVEDRPRWSPGRAR